MMMALLVLKTRIKDLYEKHYKVLRPMLKILIAAGVLSSILYALPFSPGIRYYAVPLVIVVALFCGFIPDMAVLCIAVAVMIAEVAAASVISAFTFFILIVIYFLLFGRYTDKQSYIVFLIPILWEMNLAYTVPVIAALFLSPAMIPACIAGILIRYFLAGVKQYFLLSQSAVDTGNSMEGLQYLFDYIADNKEMVVYMITFAVAYLLVFAVRKGRYNYASQIGIFVGLVTCMAGVISGEILWSVDSDIKKLVIGVAASALIAYIVQFFRMSLDYTGIRKLQFEDDEYFYYVKAVPKLKVTVVDKTVTRIEEEKGNDVLDLKDEIEKVLGEDLGQDVK
ncbi:MAG: hypothetical protein NC293_07475 [Roseburia sp.]|nr:hypothetical protein [Roseburia sp.]